MINIQKDGRGQPYIQWEQAPGGWKRAWIQRKEGDGNWAGTIRYINVCRTGSAEGGPAGNATDFPIFTDHLSDEQVLEAFVAAVCAVTGCKIP